MTAATLDSKEIIYNHIRKEATINFFLNLIINAVIAWFALGKNSPLTLWGEHSFGPDLITTAVILGWLLGGIFIFTHRMKVRKGQLPALDLDIPRWLPRNSLLAGLCFCVATLVCFLPITFATFYALDISTLTIEAYCVFKGVWAGVIAMLVVPLAILVGLSTESK